MPNLLTRSWDRLRYAYGINAVPTEAPQALDELLVQTFDTAATVGVGYAFTAFANNVAADVSFAALILPMNSYAVDVRFQADSSLVTAQLALLTGSADDFFGSGRFAGGASTSSVGDAESSPVAGSGIVPGVQTGVPGAVTAAGRNLRLLVGSRTNPALLPTGINIEAGRDYHLPVLNEKYILLVKGLAPNTQVTLRGTMRWVPTA